ncbi:MAG: hypothetical protein FWC68_06420 [Oscillospiraceae bacterium]|nr:hypothetical protein [Oscillospiraceae bacterium]
MRKYTFGANIPCKILDRSGLQQLFSFTAFAVSNYEKSTNYSGAAIGGTGVLLSVATYDNIDEKHLKVGVNKVKINNQIYRLIKYGIDISEGSGRYGGGTKPLILLLE